MEDGKPPGLLRAEGLARTLPYSLGGFKQACLTVYLCCFHNLRLTKLG